MTKAYDNIAAALLAQTDSAGKWKPCWHERGLTMPKNAITGRKYSGMNIISLWCQGSSFTLPLWATYRQWMDAGAQVIRGSKGTPICFFTVIKDEKTGKPKSFFARQFTVFNRDQVTGAPPLSELPVNPDDRVAEVQVFIGNIKKEATVEETESCDQPCYIPSKDKILMPVFEAFHHAEGYYTTLLHELTHWTGHKSREDRVMTQDKQDYAFEELVAELGACFMAADLGLEVEPRPDHACYLKNWHALLSNDPALFAKAASLAKKASERLHSIAMA